MRWQRLILLFLILLGAPAAYLLLVVYLDLIHPKSSYEWVGLALLYYGAWLALAFGYFQALPNMLGFLRKKKPQEYVENQKLEFPYEILRPSDLYTRLTTLSHYNLPYVARVGDSEYADLVNTMRRAGNLMILGRSGIGKTREAVEFIRRLESELGEDITVLLPKGSVEVPPLIDINKLGRNVVLLIDDLPAHSATPYRTFEPNDPKLLDSFRQRIELTLQSFSNIYGAKFRIIATAKGDSEFQDRIDLTDPLWRQFEVIDLPDLSSDRRYRFLQTAESHFGLNISIAAKMELQKRSDGTFSGLIFPLLQEKSKDRKQIELEDVEKYQCTYPNDWEQQVYRRQFSSNIYRRNILAALSILRQAGVTPLNFIVIDLAARLCSRSFPYLYRWMIRRELLRVADWVRSNGDILECEDAYLKGKGSFPEHRLTLLKSIYRAMRGAHYFRLLRPSLYQLINSFIYQLDDPVTAKEINKRLLQGDPESGFAWTRIAGIYCQLRDYKNAENAALRSIDINGHPQAWARLGTIYGAQRKFQKSISAYREAIKTDSTSDFLLTQLCVMLSRAGYDDEAISVGRKAVRLNRFNPFAYIALGISLDKARHFKEAIKVFNEAVSLDDQNPIAWSSLGVAYSKDGELEKAVEAGTKATRLAPQRSSTWSNLAQTYDRFRNFETAIGLFQQALELEPQNTDTLIALGIAFDRSGQSSKAIDTLNQALKLSQHNVSVVRTLSILLIKLERYEEAIKMLRSVLKTQPRNVELLTLLASALSNVERHEEASEQYSKALELEPNNVQTLISLSFACSNLRKQPEEAIKTFQRALTIEPKNVQALMGLSFALNNLGQVEEAAKHLKQVLTIEPNNVRALMTLGFTLNNSGQVEEAAKYLRQLITLEPNNVKVLLALGFALNHLDQAEEATKHLKHLLTLEPHNVPALMALSYALNSLNQGEEAIEHLRHVLTLEPDHSKAVLALSYALTNLGQAEKAAEHLRHALTLEPANAEAMVALGYALNDLGQYSEAIQILNRATDIASDQASTWKALAKVSSENGDLKTTMEALKQAVACEPEDFEAWHILTQRYTDIGDFENSIHALWKTLELKPDSSRAWASAKILLIRIKSTQISLSEEAREKLNALSQMNSRNKTADKELEDETTDLWSLGESYLHADQVDQALAVFSQAIEKNPTRIDDLYQLGMELNYSNRTLASLQVALKLTQIVPDNAKFAYALATNYRKLGDRNKAREFYLRTIELMPFGTNANRARAKLRDLETESG